MKIKYKDIILRDMIESDIDDYVLWFTKDINWQDYDAPWEKAISIESEELIKWTNYYNYVKTIKEDDVHYKFEIEYNGIHIGWVSSYYINEKYEYVSIDSNCIKYRAIGIDICDSKYQGHGIGTKALEAFIKYNNNIGINELYTQTWSGNDRMIKLAQKLNFVLCDRKIGARTVNNKKYDALTFVLNNNENLN